MPAIKAMAAECRVAPLTMWRGVQRLKQSGELEVEPTVRGTIRPSGTEPVARPEPPLEPPRPVLPRWRQIQDLLGRDLLSGVFPPGARLPSNKELCRRYGSDHATVRAALTSLAATGRIVAASRGYSVYQPAALRRRSTLVVYTFDISQGTADISRTTARSAELWRTLEAECVRLNVQMQIRSAYDMVDGAGEAAPGQARKTVLPDPNAIGHVVMTLAIEHLLDRVLPILMAPRVPIALFTEAGPPVVPACGAKDPRVRTFTIAADRQAGRQMARYLLALGHRRIAAFTQRPNIPWAEERAGGMDEALAEAGLSERVARFYVTRHATDEAMVEEIAGVEPYRAMLAALRRPGISPTFLFAEENMLVYRRFLRDRIGAELDRMLSGTGVTACVGTSDEVALAVLSCLRKRHAPAAQPLSVAGFDDTVEAFGAGLTSYNFSVPAAVRAFVEHVVAPPRRRSPGQLPVLEVPGSIMERLSSRQARG